MKVLISGSSGLIGSALAASLEADGHGVVRLKRSRRADGDFFDAAPRDFEGADAAVNLCGFGIMRRWTASVKREIERSRVESAGFLSSVFSKLASPPKVFLCASATGFYGNRGDETLTEESAPGEGFLADVARRWEDAANRAAPQVPRIVNLRFGVVLSKRSAALRVAKVAFSLGLGAKAGDGSAFVSWISLADAVRAMRFVIDNGAVCGPVNIVSPSPVRGGDFSRSVGRALGRPVPFSVGERLVKLVFGEMGKEVIMSGARVVPQKLLKDGFRFEDEDLETFLRLEIGGGRRG